MSLTVSKRVAWAGLLLGVLAAGPPLAARQSPQDSNKTKAAATLEETLRELRSLREAHYDRWWKLQDRKQLLEERLQEEQEEVDRLREALSELNAERAAFEKEKQASEQALASAREAIDRLARVVERTAACVLAQAHGDRVLPERDWVRRWKESEAERVLPLAKRLRRLWSLIDSELAYSRRSEAEMAEIETAGNRKRLVHLLRIGRACVAYLAPGFDEAGILERGQSDAGSAPGWRTDLTPAEREALRRSLDVLAGRRPPEMLVVPAIEVDGVERRAP